MKRTRLSPQEAAAEAVNREARAKAAKEREAQRKAQRREDADKRVTDLRMKATLLSNWPLTEEGEEAQKIQYVIRDIGRTWLNLHEELSDRQATFLASPANYFEWASSDMEIACKREILDSILYRLGEEGHDVQPSLRLVDIVAEVAERLTEDLLNNHDRPTSTSPAHNATMIAKAEARSHMLRWHLKGWLKILKPEFKVT
jgi:hypothetical protein